MTIAAVLVAAVLAQAPAAAPELGARPPEALAGATDPGPFRAGELVASGAGVLVGDAAAVALAYGALRLFVNGTISPTATHFRNAAYVLAASSLLLPPLGATLGGVAARDGRARGHAWTAFLLSMVGHAAALATGYLAAPHYWALLPVQLATMTAGTTFGLHWGPAPRDLPAARGPSQPPPPPRVAALSAPICPDVR